MSEILEVCGGSCQDEEEFARMCRDISLTDYLYRWGNFEASTDLGMAVRIWNCLCASGTIWEEMHVRGGMLKDKTGSGGF